MAAVVIDASLASAWCFPDEQTDYTKAVLTSILTSAVDAVAPALWAYEVRNSLLMGIRRRRITASHADQFLKSLSDLRVQLVEPSYDDIFVQAQQSGLTIYDAAYLNVALRERVPLATLDKELQKAIVSAGGQLHTL